jgi:hypothetical protein
MNQQLKDAGGISLMKVIEANLNFLADFAGWAQEWFEENGYEGFMSLEDGYMEVIGVPKKDKNEH